uniref:Uncharacterized protein n=1 Tax=Candidatus Kentrum sp. SD TaxID=2126332 RepID=A0A450YMQ2_9GAMM|nr:MAG: hypothetical protein BECKSD772F_GA0070984_11297 [Candidatus Kentron sp. SD]VFK48423.1 MAG: hypothetical protein BECKSD772E_GA0070983_11247 [Candidatus Kentron sp. SD]
MPGSHGARAAACKKISRVAKNDGSFNLEKRVRSICAGLSIVEEELHNTVAKRNPRTVHAEFGQHGTAIYPYIFLKSLYFPLGFTNRSSFKSGLLTQGHGSKV